jgi:hypothetical protein
MNKPVFFLAFANQADRPLKSLEEEENSIVQSLSPLAAYDFIQLENQGSTTIEKLFQKVVSFQNRLTLFHYGGHADDVLLELEGQAAQAEGLAGLLGREENLMLIFLNGCSTKGQVKLLLEKNVKAVIATHRPINDERARDFAIQFYKSLAGRRSIENAFQDAADRLKTENRSPGQDVAIHRAASFDGEENERGPEFPWGLFVKDEQALKWTIPIPFLEKFSDPHARKVYEEHNRQFFQLNELRGRADARNQLAQIELKGLERNWNTLNEALTRLRDALVTETDPVVQMKYEKAIESRERMSNQLAEKISRLESDL